MKVVKHQIQFRYQKHLSHKLYAIVVFVLLCHSIYSILPQHRIRLIPMLSLHLNVNEPDQGQWSTLAQTYNQTIGVYSSGPLRGPRP